MWTLKLIKAGHILVVILVQHLNIIGLCITPVYHWHNNNPTCIYNCTQSIHTFKDVENVFFFIMIQCNKYDWLVWKSLATEMGRHIVFSSDVCLSVCLSVTLSCLLFIFWTPGWIYKLLCTNVYEWWDDVQCLCLTNVWSRSRSQFKI